MKNSSSYLASKYARAFLNVYGHAQLDNEQRQSEQIVAFFKTNRHLSFFLNLPRQYGHVQKIVIERLVQQFVVSQSLQTIFFLLVDHQRMYLIPSFCVKLIELIDIQNKRTRCKIASWPSLTESQKDTMKAFALKHIGLDIIPTYSDDPSMIAGVSLTTNAVCWEYSIRKKLATIERLLRDGD